MEIKVGQWAIIANSGTDEFMLPYLCEVLQVNKDTVEVMRGSASPSAGRYWDDAVLQVYDTQEEAQHVLDMHKQYREVVAANRAKEKSMRLAIQGYIKHFS